MGIVNVTPDSFHDGGRLPTVDAARAHAARLAAEGADVVDIGAESSRPGHAQIGEAAELARLLPVLDGLAAELGVPISVDTWRAGTAAAALKAGARIVNDIWGLQRDPDIAHVAATHGAGVVIMANRDAPDPDRDPIDTVSDFFDVSLKIARQAGIDSGRIMLDPGIGFGKTPAQNIAVLARLDMFGQRFAEPILVGASRKSFIGHLVKSTTDERLPGTIVAHLAAVARGAAMIRVHDVAAHRQALIVEGAIADASRAAS